eukprot:595928_1
MLFLVVITLYIDSIMNSHPQKKNKTKPNNHVVQIIHYHKRRTKQSQTIMSYKSSITSKVKVLKFKKRMNEMLDIVWKKRNYMDMDLDSDTVLIHKQQKKPFLMDLLNKLKRHKVDFSHNNTCSSNDDTIETDAAQCVHCKQWFPDQQRLSVHTVYSCQEAWIGNRDEKADTDGSDMFQHDSLDESEDPLNDDDHIPAMFSKGKSSWEAI